MKVSIDINNADKKYCNGCNYDWGMCGWCRLFNAWRKHDGKYCYFERLKKCIKLTIKE